MSAVRRNNVTLEGDPDARPMVLAHGFGCDQTMWRAVWPAFASTHRIVLFDHVGAGGSDLSAFDEARYATLDGYAADVLELCEELAVPKVVYTSTLAVNSDTGGRVVDESYRFQGRHLTIYDSTKAEAHHLAESFQRRGLPLVIVQPGVIYGPGDTSGVRTTFVDFLRRRPARGAARSGVLVGLHR